MVHQLLYVSRAVYPMGHRTDIDILTRADERNQQEGLTGFLLRGQKWFCQVLEGQPENIERIYGMIRYDTRHFGLMEWRRGPVEGRLFPDWTMGFASMYETNPQMLFLRLSSSNIDVGEKIALMRTIAEAYLERDPTRDFAGTGRFGPEELSAFEPRVQFR